MAVDVTEDTKDEGTLGNMYKIQSADQEVMNASARGEMQQKHGA